MKIDLCYVIVKDNIQSGLLSKILAELNIPIKYVNINENNITINLLVNSKIIHPSNPNINNNDLNNLVTNKVNNNSKISKKDINEYLAHIKILENIHNLNDTSINNILIINSDIKFINPDTFTNEFSKVIEHMPKVYGTIGLCDDINFNGPKAKCNEFLYYTNDSYNTKDAFIISKHWVKEILTKAYPMATTINTLYQNISRIKKRGYLLKYPLIRKRVSYDNIKIPIIPSISCKNIDTPFSNVIIIASKEEKAISNANIAKLHTIFYNLTKNEPIIVETEIQAWMYMVIQKCRMLVIHHNTQIHDQTAFMTLLKHASTSVPISCCYMGFTTHRVKNPLTVNKYLEYIHPDMPKIKNYIINSFGAKLCLKINEENMLSKMNTILCKERIGFACIGDGFE